MSYPFYRKPRNSECGISGIVTDGGRTVHGETRDCTVRAYSIAAEITYEQAWIELSLAGRKPKHGINVTPFFNSKFGNKFDRPHATVGRFINFVCKPAGGNWIILMKRHVFTVKDGVIHDLISSDRLINCHVLGAWKVK